MYLLNWQNTIGTLDGEWKLSKIQSISNNITILIKIIIVQKNILSLDIAEDEKLYLKMMKQQNKLNIITQIIVVFCVIALPELLPI